MQRRESDYIEPIVPVEFTPPKGDGPGFVFRWRWLYGAIAAFAALSGFAAWFVLTAKSVFVRSRPNHGGKRN